MNYPFGMAVTKLRSWAILLYHPAAGANDRLSLPRRLPNADIGRTRCATYPPDLARPSLRRAFANSVAYVLINIAITIPVALPAAYALRGCRFCADKHPVLSFIPSASPPPLLTTAFSTFFRACIVQFRSPGIPAPLSVQLPAVRSGSCRLIAAVPPKRMTRRVPRRLFAPRYMLKFCTRRSPGHRVTAFSALCSSGRPRPKRPFARILPPRMQNPISRRSARFSCFTRYRMSCVT